MERLHYVFSEREYKHLLKDLEAMGFTIEKNEHGGYNVAGAIGKGVISSVLEKDSAAIHFEITTDNADQIVAKLGNPYAREKIMPTNLDVAKFILSRNFATLNEITEILIKELGMSQVAAKNAISAILRLGTKETAPKEIREAALKLQGKHN